MNVLCDLRHLTKAAFWTKLTAENLVYLGAHPDNEPDTLPGPITVDSLPTSFAFTASSKTFSDDPWRAMVGFSRKVQTAASPAPPCDGGSDYKYCERCMYRGCVDGSQSSGPSVDYFEFRWAYFLNDATLYDSAWWPTSTAHTTFKNLYQALPPADMETLDTAQWMAAAENVISLCRAGQSGSYVVPRWFIGDGKLPGYISGYEKLEADPACDAPTCA